MAHDIRYEDMTVAELILRWVEQKERGRACPFVSGELHKSRDAKLCSVAK